MMEFFSNGKFLLTGEYLVTKGAKGLALPLAFNQSLKVVPSEHKEGVLSWESYEYQNKWFEAQLDYVNMKVIQTNNEGVANRLIDILKQAQELNPSFLQSKKNIAVTTVANFKMKWGIGSSSTLINNIAKWADINPYDLLARTFKGSGYDIACANSRKAIFYQIVEGEPTVSEVSYVPECTEKMMFMYLGEKANSQNGMTYFNANCTYTDSDIQRFSQIAEQWAKATKIEDIEALIDDHENRMSEILKFETIKNKRFSDYPYAIKSLGAWGGDFALVTFRNADDCLEYFRAKGIDTFYSFNELTVEDEIAQIQLF